MLYHGILTLALIIGFIAIYCVKVNGQNRSSQIKDLSELTVDANGHLNSPILLYQGSCGSKFIDAWGETSIVNFYSMPDNLAEQIFDSVQDCSAVSIFSFLLSCCNNTS